MNKLNIGSISFPELRTLKGFSMIVLGAGGDLNDWVNGIADVLKKENIVKPEPATFISAAVISGNVLGSKGRKDLLLTFNPESNVQIGKLAMWRLRFGDISWVEDFIVNYGKDFGVVAAPEVEAEAED